MGRGGGMVMAVKERAITLGEFQEFVARPENTERRFELIDGEIIEMSPSRTSNAEKGDLIAFAVRLFCKEHKLPCHTTTGDGAYNINGHTVAPDFAYKPTPMSNEYPDPVPPLLAVEIISPTDKPIEIHKKRRIYIQAGILYWELYPEAESIDVYPPGKPAYTVGIDGTLDGEDVLPGFTLAVRDLFGDDNTGE
jgi:Uma2 family endonuclease